MASSFQPADILAELGISVDVLRSQGLSQQSEATSLEVAEVNASGREHLLTPI